MAIAKSRLTAGVLILLLGLPLWAADFSVEPAGAPPAEGVSEAIRSLLQPEGLRVKGPDGKVVAEYWGRAAEFSGDPAAGFGIRFDNIPEGALIGLVRFADAGSDFREQKIPPGSYTMRYTLQPEDGNHMGAAPSRDFSVLTPAEADKEPQNNYGFDDLVEMAKAIPNPHPTIARLELPEGDTSPHIWENDFEHWILDLMVAGKTVGIVVYGHSEE